MHSPKPFSRWLHKWLKRKPAQSDLPLGLTETQIQGLKQVTSSPSWPHYLAALEALADQQTNELASGLPHDRYLFTCGALYALRRAYTLADDIVTLTRNLKEIHDVRERANAEHQQRTASAFINTPWWDQFVRDRINGSR